ncbi:MAG: DUF1844 domain-containing protein [Terriglobia bacterium]
MPEQSAEEKNFKVVDRRAFTVEGARRADAPRSEDRDEPAVNARPAAAAETGKASPAGKPGDDRVDEGFAMLVELLANGALTHLGLMDSGTGEAMPVNVPGARTMIDLIGVLQDKTQGNLSPAEDKFLGTILFELHTRFIEMQKSASSKRK